MGSLGHSCQIFRLEGHRLRWTTAAPRGKVPRPGAPQLAAEYSGLRRGLGLWAHGLDLWAHGLGLWAHGLGLWVHVGIFGAITLSFPTGLLDHCDSWGKLPQPRSTAIFGRSHGTTTSGELLIACQLEFEAAKCYCNCRRQSYRHNSG